MVAMEVPRMTTPSMTGMEKLPPQKSGLADLSLPVAVLAAYWFFAGIFFKPSLQFYWLRDAPYAATAIMLGLELGLMATILSLRLGRFQRQPLPTSSSLFILWAFLAWAGISLGWSYTVKPMETAGYWVQQVTAVFLTLECCAFIPGDAGPRMARRAYAAGLALMAVQAIAFHRLEKLDPLELEWYKNDYANAAALLTLLGLDGLARREWLINRGSSGWVAAVMLGGLVIAHYTSKTVVGALAAAGAIHLILGKGGSKKWVAVAFMALGLTVALWDPIAETWDKYNRDAAYASTFSERTVLWEYVWRFIGEHPVLGLGFDGFRNAVPGIFNVGVSHAHNDVLMVWVNLGLVGLALASAWYVSFFLTIVAARKVGGLAKAETVLPLSLLVYVLIRGQFEADRFLTALPIDLATVCLIAMIRTQARPALATPSMPPQDSRT